MKKVQKLEELLFVLYNLLGGVEKERSCIISKTTGCAILCRIGSETMLIHWIAIGSVGISNEIERSGGRERLQ